MHFSEVWKFLAGLGFFLYGMNLLEEVLKNASGRSLKLFLKRNTDNLFKAIIGSAIVTGIVQSSSVVSLIVLAFVESGIISFRNALGVILGANLGTTLDSWIVATIGFKENILSYALHLIAVTAIGMFFFERRKNLHNLFTIFFSIGILFLGLGFMKEGATFLVTGFDISSYNQHNLFVFIIIGFALTTVIQSSSATIAITLTAIYAGAITLHSAAAVVIGSEIGTTIKIVLWGMRGSSDKKRVAWGNFIYNIFTGIIAYIFIDGLLHVIVTIFRIKDPLIGLVFFQSSINIISIILFAPFLRIFSKWLENKFVSDSSNSNSYIGKNLPLISVLAVDTLQKESLNLFNKTVPFIKKVLCGESRAPEGLMGNFRSLTRQYVSFDDEYDRLKQTEGDILGYYTNILASHVDKKDAKLMLQYIHAARMSVYAAKSIKDIAHNLKDFEGHANDNIHGQAELICAEWKSFDELIRELIQVIVKGASIEMENLISNTALEEEKHKQQIIAYLKNELINEVDASTLLNVYREISACKKSILLALHNLSSELTNPTKI